jgi:hypothetical protein
MITLDSLMPHGGVTTAASVVAPSPKLCLNWCWYPDQDVLQIEHWLVYPDGKSRMIEFQQTGFWKCGLHKDDRFRYQSELGAFENHQHRLTHFRINTWHSGERHLQLYGHWTLDRKKQICFKGKATEIGQDNLF